VTRVVVVFVEEVLDVLAAPSDEASASASVVAPASSLLLSS
jgi:hypothetical protein